ncbi:cupin domain-containing protein [Bradyrhizobium sp. LHD-71]|uniref:cupin domain-containing protein n=1 Tax=Bradyrhizobium sp. LHD-71 TaxID=3072141 RepID=UPI00280C6AE8|nr:cupin domain-containing protein [Bradyrhizobium sp. LHD-71]MDQ8732152.1 cupin domain-containing protein [Bradyrhizobium sp. LHD-71]
MPFVCTTPAVPTLLAEDERAKITRWDFAPGATTGWHEHAMDYAVVMMTDATMAYEMDGVVTETTLKAGQSYIRPAGIKHDVRNNGENHMAFIEIEMKR